MAKEELANIAIDVLNRRASGELVELQRFNAAVDYILSNYSDDEVLSDLGIAICDYVDEFVCEVFSSYDMVSDQTAMFEKLMTEWF